MTREIESVRSKLRRATKRLTVNLWTMTMIFMVRRVRPAAMGLAPVWSLLGYADRCERRYPTGRTCCRSRCRHRRPHASACRSWRASDRGRIACWTSTPTPGNAERLCRLSGRVRLRGFCSARTAIPAGRQPAVRAYCRSVVFCGSVVSPQRRRSGSTAGRRTTGGRPGPRRSAPVPRQARSANPTKCVPAAVAGRLLCASNPPTQRVAESLDRACR